LISIVFVFVSDRLKFDFLFDFGSAERTSGRQRVLALPTAADVAARQKQDITLKRNKTKLNCNA
jgi:hypothetical protein